MTSRRPRSPLARAALSLLCALLLFAQQVGLSHAVWHATQRLPQPIHGLQQVGSSEAPALPHASKLCPLDAALGQVLGAGPVAGFAFDYSPAGTYASPCAEHHPTSLQALAPRSRGPPTLL